MGSVEPGFKLNDLRQCHDASCKTCPVASRWTLTGVFTESVHFFGDTTEGVIVMRTLHGVSQDSVTVLLVLE